MASLVLRGMVQSMPVTSWKGVIVRMSKCPANDRAILSVATSS